MPVKYNYVAFVNSFLVRQTHEFNAGLLDVYCIAPPTCTEGQYSSQDAKCESFTDANLCPAPFGPDLISNPNVCFKMSLSAMREHIIL
jgi:hypothetical protein